jgi:hypothetical protein
VNVESDEANALLSALEAEHGKLGPVLSGESPASVDVILLADDADESQAAREMYDAVVDGLRAAGLGHLYPTAVEIESADELVTA